MAHTPAFHALICPSDRSDCFVTAFRHTPCTELCNELEISRYNTFEAEDFVVDDIRRGRPDCTPRTW